MAFTSHRFECDFRAEFVWQLSGGQKHLLALAGAIAMKPKVVPVRLAHCPVRSPACQDDL